MIFLDAYIRRQQFLARLQAAEISRILFGDKKAGGGGSQGHREISTAAMFERIE
jgi:hypothetical protein